MAVTVKFAGAARQVILFALVAAVALAVFRRRSGPEEGVQAPPFTAPIVFGGTGVFDVSSERGKPVLIEAFTSWCGVCERMAPTLAEVAKAPRRRDVKFVGMSLDDSMASAVGAARSWQIPYNVALDDGSFARKYEISVLPTFVLIDEHGRVRRVASGGISRSELESWLDEVGASAL